MIKMKMKMKIMRRILTIMRIKSNRNMISNLRFED
jgi:hypothetical protein